MFARSSTQKLALHHDSALLQPAMNAVGLCSLIKWKHKCSRMIGWSQVKRFQHQNGVRNAYRLIAKHALLFELRFCDLRIAPVTKHLLVQASDFNFFIESNYKIMRIFRSEKLINSSCMKPEQRNHMLGAVWSSSLSEDSCQV